VVVEEAAIGHRWLGRAKTSLVVVDVAADAEDSLVANIDYCIGLVVVFQDVRTKMDLSGYQCRRRLDQSERHAFGRCVVADEVAEEAFDVVD
jgi:hypothetical protein